MVVVVAALTSWEEEEEVLDSFKADAREGKVVTANDVHAALQARTGRKVSLQTAYNVLYRHHWRKVAPDKAHPKNDPAKIEEFKKKRFPTRYTWLPSAQG